MTSLCRFLAAALLLVVAAPGAWGAASATLTLGRGFNGNIRETPTFQAGAVDAYFAGLSLGRTVLPWREWARWEVEGQILKHFGLQAHWEATGAVALRWLAFPWGRYLQTSVAVGDGLSYATRTPELEASLHRRTEKLLNYLFFEVALAVPSAEQWSLVLRQHHRSGVFGTFGGVRGGSDFLTLGVRRAF